MDSLPYGVAAITGASSGIGRAVALELGRRGVAVALLARRLERLEEVAAAVRAEGGTALAVACDVAERESVEAAIARARGELGPIDLLVANAGIGTGRRSGELDVDGAERVYRVNVLGTLHAIHAVLPEMLERGRGHLVGVSSLAGYQGLPGKAAYCASKAAQRIHLEGLRVELRPKGVAVTTICPGFVRTPLTDENEFDMPFLMEPGPAARRIVRAIGRRRRVCEFPRRLAWIVRLGRMMPRWLYDRVAAGGPDDGTRTQPRSGEEGPWTP